MLYDLVSTMQFKKDWISISALIKTKTPRQCYDFYKNSQNAEGADARRHSDYHSWTAEEEDLLMNKEQSNMTWTEFRLKHFPQCTLGQLKNKYCELQSKKTVVKPRKVDPIINQLMNLL